MYKCNISLPKLKSGSNDYYKKNLILAIPTELKCANTKKYNTSWLNTIAGAKQLNFTKTLLQLIGCRLILKTAII